MRRFGLLTHHVRAVTKSMPAQIVKNADGPAAKELAWEGFLRAEESWIPRIDVELARKRFDEWWDKVR